MPTPWDWVVDRGLRCKAHACPAPLTQALLADLEARLPGVPFETEYVNRVFIDEPGISFIGMPAMSYRIDGLVVSMSAHDVGSFASQLRNLRRRRFDNGVDYYKLHAAYKAIVLSPWDHMELRDLVEQSLQEAERLADEFVANMKKQA